MNDTPQTGALEVALGFVLNAPFRVALLDLEGRLIAKSPAMQTATWSPKREAVDQADSKSASETRSAMRLQEVLQKLRDGVPVVGDEHRLWDGEGRSTHVRAQTSYWRDGDGRPVAVLSIVQHIDAEVEAREALRQSEVRLRAVIENMPAQISLMGLDSGRVLLMNSSMAERIASYTGAREGCIITDQVSAEHMGHVQPYIDAAEQGCGPSEIEHTFEDGVCAGCTYRMKFVVFRDERGGRQLLWTGEDITLLRQSEEALRRALMEAEAANAAKSEFLANMSHEIRTPLNGMLTMAEVLSHGDLSSEQHGILSVVRQSGHDLLHLLNDILDFSKIEAGKLLLEETDFDSEKVLEATVAGFRALAEEKHLELALDVAASAKGVRCGDPTRLRQIVANFVSNALKFTQTGGVRIRVEGLGASGRDGLQLAVRDTGLGIPADKMALLFKKFSQVDASTTRRFGGTGLGLAICQELTALMGGQVWVESVEGEGSTFYATFKLPYIRDVTAEAHDDNPACVCEPPSETLRLLAAEDNPTNQLVLTTVMKLFGFELTLVGDGAQAVAAWREGTFDAILMDVQMPVMDGVQATRQIRMEEARLRRPRIPIIALSANAFSHQVSEYLEAGMDTHVAKPIELPALQAALEYVLMPAELANTA